MAIERAWHCNACGKSGKLLCDEGIRFGHLQWALDDFHKTLSPECEGQAVYDDEEAAQTRH